MKKIILIFVLFLLSNSEVLAYKLQGSISYTVDAARNEAFQNVNNKINMSDYTDYLIDSNKFNKHKKNLNNPKITNFSNGVYSISYKNNPQLSYIYFENGQLKGIAFRINKKYPKKTIAYDNKGNLSSVMYTLKNDEQFIFDKNKKLVAHWIGNNCYNEQGELIMTRE